MRKTLYFLVGFAAFSAAAAELEVRNDLLGYEPANGGYYDLTTQVGADAFYNYGIFGQESSVANIEADFAWNGHETLTHVTNFFSDAEAIAVSGTPQDMHATMVSTVIGGRDPDESDGMHYWYLGIAPYTGLSSGAIATYFGTDGAFNISAHSLLTPYEQAFGSHDVINSSWGGTDSAGINPYTAVAIDALAYANPETLLVVSAGNDGAANSVGSPGSGYNSLTVGAIDSNGGAFDQVADFSSRGPQDWGANDGGVVETVAAVRAPVDIVAPGTYVVTSGTTAPTNYYYASGTSFSSPIVAGGAALLHSTANMITNIFTETAHDARVIKSVLMNSADKLPGWDNGQTNIAGIITTSRSLDYEQGAGALNLGNALDQYAFGTVDAGEFDGTDTAQVVDVLGWDLGVAGAGWTNNYLIGNELNAGDVLTATVSWFRDRDYAWVDGATRFDDTVMPVENAQVDLNLYVYHCLVDTNAGTYVLGSLYAQSISEYNMSEHLNLEIGEGGYYMLAVGNDGSTWGDLQSENYGLAWNVSPIPEPATLVIFGSGLVSAFLYRRRKRHAAEGGIDQVRAKVRCSVPVRGAANPLLLAEQASAKAELLGVFMAASGSFAGKSADRMARVLCVIEDRCRRIPRIPVKQPDWGAWLVGIERVSFRLLNKLRAFFSTRF